MSEVLDRPSVRTKREFAVIGKPLPRIDGVEKVTGAARYTADYQIPGMLIARVLRSPHAHARILRVDTSKAEAYPGVVTVVTGADMADLSVEPTSRGHNMLARTQVLFAGQPVAVVAAVSREVADEAVALVEVEYEVLPPVLDPVEAMKRGAPTIRHEGSEAGMHVDRSEEKLHAGGAGELEEEEAGEELNNVSSQVHFKRGDVEAGFKEADEIVEGTWIHNSVHQGYMEPQSTIAHWDASGSVRIWTSTQAQFGVRDNVARLFKLPISKVVVTGAEIGGGFGAKFGTLSLLPVLVSRKAKRPVKLIYSRSDDMVGATPAPYTVIDVKIGAKRDGRITALKARVVMDTGAYPGAPMSIGTILCGGSYKLENFELDGYEVLTNKASVGAYRAPGAFNVAFGIEGAVELMAKRLGVNPLQLRLRNAIEEGDKWPNGNTLPAIGCRQVLEALMQHPYATRPLGPNEGRGFALGAWPGGAGAASAWVRANPDGTFQVVTGTINLSGATTPLAQIAAEELGVPLALVTLVTGDTSEAPMSPGSGGSQIVYTMGHAVSLAAIDCREQMLELAARRLEVDRKELRIEGGVIVASNGKKITYKRVADAASQGPGPIVGRGARRPGRSFPGFAATCAIVEVDKETGGVKLKNIVTAQDVGLAVNPMAVEGSIQGGTVQSVGMALTEEITYNQDGRVANPGLLDYRILTCADLPMIDTVIVEVPAEAGPYGARIVGEPSIVPPGAAVGNAIADAIRTPLHVFPATPERVLGAIRNGVR